MFSAVVTVSFSVFANAKTEEAINKAVKKVRRGLIEITIFKFKVSKTMS